MEKSMLDGRHYCRYLWKIVFPNIHDKEKYIQDHMMKNIFLSFRVTEKEILLRLLSCWSLFYLPDVQCTRMEKEHVLESNIVS